MSTARRMDFDAAWKKYCDVIRELEMTAAELDALRLAQRERLAQLDVVIDVRSAGGGAYDRHGPSLTERR